MPSPLFLVAKLIFITLLSGETKTILGAPVSTPILRKTLPGSYDESWFGSPAVFDLDGNGSKEIIAGLHGVLYVWDAKGILVWHAATGSDAAFPIVHGKFRQYAGPVVGDFDGDGKGEIAIGYDNKVAVYSSDGKIRIGWPQAFPGPAGEIRSVTASDLDNDGRLEILAVKTSDGPVTVAWQIDGKVADGWPQAKDCAECNDYGGYHQNIGVADLDGDRIPEVVSAYDMSYLGIMRATGLPYPAHASFVKAGPWASSIPMFHDIRLAQQGWGADGNDRDEFTYSPPVFGNMDEDPLPEIVLYSDHEKAGEYINRGNCLWALNPDMTRVPGFIKPICSDPPLFINYVDNIVQVAPSPALAQLAGDMRLEIVVPSYDGVMRCYNADGVMLWDYRFDEAGGDFIGASGAAIGDLNQDGMPEIIFTTYSPVNLVSNLIILTALGNEIQKVKLSKRGSMGVPTLSDVDGDGQPEIVVGLKDAVGSGSGAVQVWDVPGAGIGLLPWYTGRGNYLRDGQAPQISPTKIKSAARKPGKLIEVRTWFYNLLGARTRGRGSVNVVK